MMQLVKIEMKPQVLEKMLILKTRLSKLGFRGNVIVDVHDTIRPFIRGKIRRVLCRTRLK